MIITHQVDTVHDADAQGHEGLGEVDDLFPLRRDGQTGHGQVGFLHSHAEKKGPEGRRRALEAEDIERTDIILKKRCKYMFCCVSLTQIHSFLQRHQI